MEKSIGIEITNQGAKVAFLEDNCDAVEEKGYLKPYTPETLQGHKEKLANISIEIAEIEAEMKQVIAAYMKGFDFYGCELDKTYFDAQEERFRRECFGEQKLKNGAVVVQESLF